MIINAFNNVESLAILMKMAVLDIPMDFFAYEAVERGYISEETRD
jgi:hypothetical protein